MPDHFEAHRLGPHVVGHRVVVRRVVPGETGPSGGPAMTDVLGVCLRWSDGECVVQPEVGPPVVIALSQIVSGKPVPPRASPRFRVSPRECHLRASALWPDLVAEPLGNWLLRTSATSAARRANSVLAYGPAGVEGAYDRVVDHYERPIAQVQHGSPEHDLFRDHGWLPEGDTVFLLASVARLARALPPDLAPAILEPATLEPGLVTARLDDVATGMAAYADDWVGFRGLEVAPTHRGRGLALAVMAALVEWGAAQGATTAYLQVLDDNASARRLYERMGFATHHSYCYLTPGCVT
ncbi:MAG: GNAT family N-acetyltransferase [Nocardioides sp.]